MCTRSYCDCWGIAGKAAKGHQQIGEGVSGQVPSAEVCYTYGTGGVRDNTEGAQWQECTGIVLQGIDIPGYDQGWGQG